MEGIGSSATAAYATTEDQAPDGSVVESAPGAQRCGCKWAETSPISPPWSCVKTCTGIEAQHDDYLANHLQHGSGRSLQAQAYRRRQTG